MLSGDPTLPMSKGEEHAYQEMHSALIGVYALFC